MSMRLYPPKIKSERTVLKKFRISRMELFCLTIPNGGLIRQKVREQLELYSALVGDASESY